MIEKSITNSVLKWLNGLPNCKAEKIQGTSSSSGKADINGCINGRMFRIEMKTPDNSNEASLKQEINLAKWKKAGAITGVCYSLEEVKELIFLKH